MSKYKIIDVEFNQLEDSPYQPENRCTAIGPMNHLMNSLKTTGLQYPPLVIPVGGDKYQVVDGHRRIAAAKELGWPVMPVLITQGKPDTLFQDVSGNVAKMTAQQWVAVYLKGGSVPSGPTRTCITKLDECMGKEFLAKLVNKNINPAIWNLSNRVLKYLQYDEENRPKVLTWLFEVGSRNISAWISNGNSKEELETALNKMRSPKFA